MKKLNELVTFFSGSPQFRITEVWDETAPVFTYYSQNDLEDDRSGVVSGVTERKQVRTRDAVHTLSAGDVVFSLITGQAAMVGTGHAGFLYTQNYIKMIPCQRLNKRFLVYLLNEDRFIRKQLAMGLQGSAVLKYTLQQLKVLVLGELPALEQQEIIGTVYFNQLRLRALKHRVAELEMDICLAALAEASENEGRTI